MTPRRRRILAALGLLIPAIALLFVSVYIGLGGAGTQRCSYPGGNLQNASCSTDPAGAVLATFPIGLICLLLGVAVVRGARWARWPAAVVGAVLGTVTAAASLAVLVSLIGDGNGAGAVLFAAGAIVLTLVCALPALMLAPPEGAQALPGGRPSHNDA